MGENYKRNLVSENDEEGEQKMLNDFRYLERIIANLEKVKREQGENLHKAASPMADAIQNDKLIHVYAGGGHTTLAMEEMFSRAGGLANINPLMETVLSVFNQALRHLELERTVNFVASIVRSYDLKPGDLLIIFHNIGINPATIDAVMEAKKRMQPSSPWQVRSARRRCRKITSFIISPERISLISPKCALTIPIPSAMPLSVPRDLKPRLCRSPTRSISRSRTCWKWKRCESALKAGASPPVWNSANTPGCDEKNKAYLESAANPESKHCEENKMNIESMNKGHSLLLEKYLPGKQTELEADSEVGCGAVLKKDGEGVNLLPWRVERRFTELKKRTGNGTLEEVSTLRFAVMSAEELLRNLLCRELELCEFRGKSEIRSAFAVAAGSGLRQTKSAERGRSAGPRGCTLRSSAYFRSDPPSDLFRFRECLFARCTEHLSGSGGGGYDPLQRNDEKRSTLPVRALLVAHGGTAERSPAPDGKCSRNGCRWMRQLSEKRERIVCDCFEPGVYHNGAPNDRYAVQDSCFDEWIGLVDEFVDCIRNQKIPKINLKWHRQTIECMNACYESVRSGLPVKLAEQKRG